MSEVAEVVDSEDSSPSALIKYRDYDTYLAMVETGISTLLQAHARGIAHCDVPDANVLIDVAHNQVVILDWTNDAPPHLAGIGSLDSSNAQLCIASGSMSTSTFGFLGWFFFGGGRERLMDPYCFPNSVSSSDI
ncbi:hypothetical protein GGF50DRAFT_120996 [Schizophyllum commune]